MSDEFDDLPGLDDIDDADDLPGLDDIDDADDLPGLDDTVSGPEGNQPTAGAESAASGETPFEWSEKELDEWWERWGGDEAFDEGEGAVDRVIGSEDPDLIEAYRALLRLSQQHDAEGFKTLANPFLSNGWRRLSHEMKVKFRKGWENSGAPSEPADSVVGELAPITLLGGDWSEPGASPDESVLDELAPYPQPTPDPAAPLPGAEKTSPAPGSFNWIWLVVPVVGAALGLGLFFLMGGSDENLSTPSAAVNVPTDEPSSEDVEVATTAPAVATTTAPAALFPPEDYGPCHIHPEQDATDCRPHYDLGVSTTSMNNFGDSFHTWETSQTFMGPVPVNPEFPIEYRLVIESTNGQQIEHLLSGGPGEPLTCVRLVNGVEASLVEGEICGEFTAPDSLEMLIDVSAFSPGVVSWVFSTLETEPDGTRHGDWVAGGGNENFELGG